MSSPFSSNEYYDKVFEGLEFSGERVESIEFDSCQFKLCDFSQTHFKHCKFIDCDFVDVNCNNGSFQFSKFNDVSFTRSKLMGVDWSLVDWPSLSLPSPVKFDECLLSLGSFFDLGLSELRMRHCKVHEADFRGADLSNADCQGSDFLGALFSQTNLSDANFEEAVNYTIDVFNNKINQARFSREEAVGLLESLQIELV